jgi:hypothetical protein
MFESSVICEFTVGGIRALVSLNGKEGGRGGGERR